MKEIVMRITKILISKPRNFVFHAESNTDKNIIDLLTDELSIFNFKSQSTYPSPRQYPSAIRLIGASHYWSNDMIWVCEANNQVSIMLINDKIIKNMTALEYDDYQKNYNVQNEIITHFLQIFSRSS